MSLRQTSSMRRELFFCNKIDAVHVGIDEDGEQFVRCDEVSLCAVEAQKERRKIHLVDAVAQETDGIVPFDLKFKIEGEADLK